MSFPDDLPSLVQQFAPIVYFHSAEINLPCSTEWYLRQVGYMHVTSNGSEPYAPGSWAPEAFRFLGDDVNDYLFIPGDDGQTWDPPPAAAAIRAGDLESATAYVHVVPVTADSLGNSVEWLDIQYWFFYAFNGAESVVGQVRDGSLDVHASKLTNLSYHQADWEHIVVRIDSSLNIIGVFFAQHDGGTWVYPGGYSLVNSTHVQVFAGLGSHASYPQAGGPYWIQAIGELGLALGMADWTEHEPGSPIVDYSEAGRAIIVQNDATQWFSYSYAPPVPSWMGFAGHWGLPTSIPYAGAIASSLTEIISDWPPLLQVVQSHVDALAGALTGILLSGQPLLDWQIQSLELIPCLAVLLSQGLPWAWPEEGPENPPYQAGWTSEYLVNALAWDGTAWTSFPAPAGKATSGVGCVTQTQPDGTALIHAAYVGTDGYVRYQQYNGASWLQEATINWQTATGTPALAVLNGALFCVFQNGGQLFYSKAYPPDYGFPSPRPLSAPGAYGIYPPTSPALFVLDGVLYCVYQNASGDSGAGTFSCVSYDPQTTGWVQASPPTSQYPGMSNSPAVAITGDSAYVLYQCYGATGALSGATAAAAQDGPAWSRLQDSVPIWGLTQPYMPRSASPSAAAAAAAAAGQDDSVNVAFFGASGSQLILVGYDGSFWRLIAQTSVTYVSGTSPALVTNQDQPVAFYLSNT